MQDCLLLPLITSNGNNILRNSQSPQLAAVNGSIVICQWQTFLGLLQSGPTFRHVTTLVHQIHVHVRIKIYTSELLRMDISWLLFCYYNV